jgi:DNA-binding FrmR family transcriptional regulator
LFAIENIVQDDWKSGVGTDGAGVFQAWQALSEAVKSYHGVANPTANTTGLTMSRITDAGKKKALCARLARIEGQLRGLQKLIDGDADCEKIAQQMAAARKALDKSFFSMVGCMIEQGDQSAEHVAEMLTKFA